MMKWNERLRYERKSRGWTQIMLAEKIGINTYTVSRWENGNAFPHPFYREKLTALLGISFKEKEFLQDDPEFDHSTYKHSPVLSEVEQVYYEHSGSSPLSTPVVQPQPVTSLAQDPQAYKQEMYWLGDHFFSPRPLWNISINHVIPMSPFRPSNWYLRHRFLMESTILFTVLLIITALSASHGLPSNTHTQETYGPPSYTLMIQNADPSLQDTSQHLQQAFSTVYPQLVNRFAPDPTTAARNVTLRFVSDLSSPAATSSSTITFRSDWIREHPTDVGLFTYELTLTLERYPSGAPDWFSDGLANYARSVYGPANDDDWSLPDGVQPQDSYTQGGTVAGRFLLWLEYNTTPNIVDQLNHALQTKQSFSDTFRRLTHHTMGELWNQYKAQPDITPTPQQLYQTVTSRKPLYQSFFHVASSQAHMLEFAYAQGLYLSNFAMQADMTIVSGDGGGFIFRYDWRSNTYYRLRVSPDGSFDLVNRTDMLAASSFSPAIRQGFNRTNHLTIIAQKHTIYLYINNQFITQLDDNASNYGTVGMMAVNLGDSTDVQFDKVQVF